MSLNQQIFSNKLKTLAMITLFIALAATLGYIFGKAFNNANAAALSVNTTIAASLFTLLVYLTSERIILVISKAKRIKKPQYPLLFQSLEFFCQEINISIPKIYAINSRALNVLTIGRNPHYASICFTTEILNKMTNPEIEGILAHELSHIRSYDIRPYTLAAVLIGFPSLIAEICIRSVILIPLGLIISLLSPLVAAFIHVAVAPKREFNADANAILLTKHPEALASALEKIYNNRSPLKTAYNVTAHLFIVQPFVKNNNRLFSSMFNTHPSINERTRVLRSI